VSATQRGRGATQVDGRWLQTALNQVLGRRLAVDGRPGAQTRAAVRDFQASRGLVADGTVGPRTVAALQAALATTTAGAAGAGAAGAGASASARAA
jgi:peptidoglycan hydrolase-like protein with peptidoglycan-binding domain